MKEITIEQFFADVDEVHNLDKYSLTPVHKTRKVIPKRKENKKLQISKVKRQELVEKTAELIIQHATDKWINNLYIYSQLPIESGMSYMYKYELTREAKKILSSKGYIIKTRGDGRYMEWRVVKGEYNG